MKPIALAIAVVLLSGIAGTAGAASGATFMTPYSGFESWLPIVFLGILISFMIVALHYMLGAVLQNNRVKASAVGELGQVIGAVVIAVIVIGILYFVGTSEFSFVSFVSPGSVYSLCGQIGNSKLDFLSGAPSNTICGYIDSLDAGSTDITERLDYGLFASYAILANLTNQDANNLNSIYIFEGWIGFLYKFTSVFGICSPGETCFPPFVPRTISLTVSYQPLAGYQALESVARPLEAEANLTFYLLFMQMVVILILLFAWPYLLAAGMVLKSTFFARRLGGLLMAMALAAVLIFPLMYLLEYSAFSNLNLGPIGATNLPNVPVYEQLPGTSGNVIIYGSTSTGGYVPSYLAPSSSCPSVSGGIKNPQELGPSYVYESECGNANTASKGCTYSSISGAASVSPLCPQVVFQASPSSAPQSCTVGEAGCTFSGYVPYTQSPGAGCAPGDYVYETSCGTPTIQGSTVPSGVALCSATPPTDELCVSPLSSNINFFVLPNLDQALTYYSCEPTPLMGYEAAFAVYYLIPGFGIVTGLLSGAFGFVGQLPVTPLSFGGAGACNPSNAIHSVLMLTNVYGIVFVGGVLLPLLNILIALSAVSGFAVLFGGDTDILGLSRLI